jgi:hypothetical protein
MARGRRRKCKCCRKLFRPDPRWSLEPLCRQSRAAGAFREVRSGQRREFFQLAW